jgi:hypothetical protein
VRRALLPFLAAILVSTAARADHIGIYTDGTASSCVLASGFNPTVTLVHKFAAGATGSRFRVDFSSAPGSVFYSFAGSFPAVGLLNDDLSLSYGQCLTGSFVLGTMVTTLAPGQIYVRAAFGASNILYTNCSFDEVIASGGQASIGNSQCMASGTESATWGEIKSLYR